MSRSIRRAMIDRDHQQLSLVRQCILLDVSRASVYYRPVPTRAEDLELMALMDRQYLNRDCPDQTDSSNHVTLWDGSNYKRAA